MQTLLPVDSHEAPSPVAALTARLFAAITSKQSAAASLRQVLLDPSLSDASLWEALGAPMTKEEQTPFLLVCATNQPECAVLLFTAVIYLAQQRADATAGVGGDDHVLLTQEASFATVAERNRATALEFFAQQKDAQGLNGMQIALNRGFRGLVRTLAGLGFQHGTRA